jgi:hypothetical protein
MFVYSKEENPVLFQPNARVKGGEKCPGLWI